MISFFVISALIALGQSEPSKVIEIVPPGIPEDGWLNFTGLANKYGHPDATEYDITTEDGYILKMFHIPGDPRHPIFLMHGILETADDYILRGNTSLAIYLAEAGYDVWAGNVRGSRYSRKHEWLNPDYDVEFWDYGLDEYALIDLPTMIDFVLNQTQQKDLAAIAFSEGTAMFYALCSDQVEYNEKVNVLISLAPICFLHLTGAPFLLLAQNGNQLNLAMEIEGIEEFFSFHSDLKKIMNIICSQGQVGYMMCTESFFHYTGEDYDELEMEFVHVMLGHLPGGTSRKNLHHLSQISNSGRFAKYDYGLGNLAMYDSLFPPEYDVTKVTTKVAMLVGANDLVATVSSAEKLRDRLPNVVLYKVMESKKWNHCDFILARTAYKTMFPIVFEMLDKYAPLD